MPVNEGWIDFESCVQLSPDGGAQLGVEDGRPSNEIQFGKESFSIQERNSDVLHTFMVSNFKHYKMSVSGRRHYSKTPSNII